MEIVFKRRLTNELLTTYLPSFLLLLMSYATAFFKPIYFEASVTVNLSILLVTTTLFIRCAKVMIPQIICKYKILQCNGQASSNFLHSYGGHLAHIRSTVPIHPGKNIAFFRNKRILKILQILYLQVVLSTIIELNVEEEFTNDHGFRRSVPQNKNNVCSIVCFHNNHLEIYHLEHRNKALW